MSKSDTTTVPPKKQRHKRQSGARDIIPRELLDLTPNIIIIITSEGSIVEVNHHACLTLGWNESELTGMTCFKLCSEEVQANLQTLVAECFTSGGTLASLTKFLTSEGKVLDIHLTLTRYPKNRRSKRYYCVLIGRDISEEKKMKLDLLRFSNIAHFTVNPVEVTDRDGRIIYVNPAFEKASGYSKDELIGNNPKVFGSGKHPKAFWEKMWKTIKSGKVWTGEIENRKRNGDPFHTQLLISPIIDADGEVNGYFGVHRDVTEQKHLEHQLIHAQKMESIGLLAAGIAHEVGNPLTSISSLVQVIQRTTTDEFVQDKLELVKSQVIRISRIIRDLVDFSRRSSYEIQMTDVNKNLREAVEIVRVGRKAKDITFQVALDENIPKIPLVPDQIEQVFINIIINAVDAINSTLEESNMRPKQRNISIQSLIKDEYIVILIHDSGKGISEEHLSKIFEPFFTTKKVGEGTGLGLWVSYGIVKSFQGMISVESSGGDGTTFTISLPIQPELH